MQPTSTKFAVKSLGVGQAHVERTVNIAHNQSHSQRHKLQSHRATIYEGFVPTLPIFSMRYFDSNRTRRNRLFRHSTTYIRVRTTRYCTICPQQTSQWPLNITINQLYFPQGNNKSWLKKDYEDWRNDCESAKKEQKERFYKKDNYRKEKKQWRTHKKEKHMTFNRQSATTAQTSNQWTETNSGTNIASIID